MPDNNISSNKRIAKNTLLLYARMLLLLVVSLFTSRIVLATLGIDDFGIYNVVGGIVNMFTFLNAAMGNSSHRFIMFALGKGDKKELKEVIGATCMIHWIMAIIILILAETVGLWFLHNKMVIPANRMVAAEWVYQFSIITCVFSILSVPYNAMIIAHEKMGAFASISILDAVLRLLIVFLILHVDGDKLILYAGLICGITVLDRLIYQIYCRIKFDEAKHIRFIRFSQLKDMASFAGWSLIGNFAYFGYTQGLNILLNIFFGPAVNAARGIAVQVQGAVKGFVTNFQTAVTPQIVKSYSQGDFNRLHMLVYSSSKLSFFLLYCIVLPITIEAKTILGLWLTEVPDYAVIFTVLVLWVMLIEPLSNPIDMANRATGKIRNYQLGVGGMSLLILPIAYIVLKLGAEPYAVFIVQFAIMIIVQILRLFLVCHKIKMSKLMYIKKVLIPVIYVAVSSSIIPIVLYIYLSQSITSFIIVVISSIISVLICSYFLGLNSSERKIINGKLKIAYEKVNIYNRKKI